MKTLTNKELIAMSLEPIKRAIVRFYKRRLLAGHYRHLALVNDDIRDQFAAQRYLHREISRLESELRT